MPINPLGDISAKVNKHDTMYNYPPVSSLTSDSQNVPSIAIKSLI